nr:cytochrome c [Bradyrhizobium sp. CSA112]
MTPAAAASPQELRGAIFAVDNCAKCHSSDKVSPRPLKIAPPFRTLHKRYPIEPFAEALAEGILTGHPTMSAFQPDPEDCRPADARPGRMTLSRSAQTRSYAARVLCSV